MQSSLLPPIKVPHRDWAMQLVFVLTKQQVPSPQSPCRPVYEDPAGGSLCYDPIDYIIHLLATTRQTFIHTLSHSLNRWHCNGNTTETALAVGCWRQHGNTCGVVSSHGSIFPSFTVFLTLSMGSPGCLEIIPFSLLISKITKRWRKAYFNRNM